jgi:glycosyltransferase involved in cell wall biosynthesis
MVDVIIKSFMRPQVLTKCVEAVHLYYPKNRILVGDDSQYFDEAILAGFSNVEVYRFPFDIGLSAGRNRLLEKVNTEYFLLLDHDFILHDDKTIEKMLAVATATDATIVGGLAWDEGAKAPRDYCGFFTKEDGEYVLNYYDMEKIKYNRAGDVRYCECRFTQNFMLGRTADFRNRSIHWDDDLKLMEHEDFFIRFPLDLRVITTPDVTVTHLCSQKNNSDPVYSAIRYDKAHKRRMRDKYKLKRKFFQERWGVVYDWTTLKFPALDAAE